MSNFKRIVDEKYISNLFRNLSRKKEVPATVCCNGNHVKASMLFSARHGYEPSIRLLESNGFNVGDKIKISFHNDDVLFLFHTRITSLLDYNCSFENPKTVFSPFRRVMSRYRIKQDEEALIIPNRGFKAYRLIDISSRGLAFETQYESYSVGQVLRENIIKIGSLQEVLLDGEIRHCIRKIDGSCIYGLSFLNVEWETLCNLYKYIMAKVYPQLKPIGDIPEVEMNNLLETTQYNNKKTSDVIDSLPKEKVQFIRDILNKPQIFSGFVYYKNLKPVTMSSVLRIYERTFMGQQIIAAPETRIIPNAGIQVYLGLANFMLNNPYFDYYVKYITNDLTWHQEIFEDIGAIINSTEKFIFDKLQLFECNTKEVESSNTVTDYSIEALDSPDEFIGYCQQALNPLINNCYSYNKEQFDLKEIGQVFETVGSFVKRKLWKISAEKRTIAYAVAEAYSEGLNFYNIDLCRLYFTSDEIEIKPVLQVLLPKVRSFYGRYKKEKISILLKAQVQAAKDIKLPGLEYKFETGRVIMNREGMAEYKILLGENFVNYVKYYPLTHPQLAIWYTEKVYPNTSFGCLAQIVRFKEKVNFELLEKAINLVIEKNDGLRLRMVEMDGQPRQYLSKYKFSKIHLYDFSKIDGEYSLETWDENKTSALFTLTDSDLFYFALLKINDNEGGFYIKVHHLISDAWTMTLLINKIVEYYSSLKRNIKIPEKSAPSYLDYVLSEEEYKSSSRFLAQKEFWSKKFETVPEFVSLKPSNTNLQSIEARRKTFTLTKQLTSEIHKYCEGSKVSPSTFFLSLLSIYINRVTSKEDIVIGVPVLNRSNQKEKDTSGMFISMIPVRLRVEPSKDFDSYTESVTKEWKQLLKNQKYPYDLIQKDFRESHKSNENLFDICLSYQNVKHEKSEFTGDYEVSWHFNGNQTESLNIHISDWDDEGEYTLHFDYRIEVFSVEEVDRMFTHLQVILNDAINRPEKRISKLNLLSDEEKHKVIFEFNNTKTEYPKDKTIYQLFEEQVENTPYDIAVNYYDRKLTYRNLNEKANQLGRLLKAKGIKRDSIVGIMADRSIEMIIGILGILKAGGAYIPIDPKYPADRIKFMLEDSSTNVLLSHQCIEDELEFCGLIIDLENENIFQGECSNLESANKPDDLAYIMYTSGSTGKPKGTMVKHRNVVRLVKNTNYIKFHKDDRILQTGSVVFDASTFEIWGSLLNGLRLYIVDEDVILDAEKLGYALSRHKITILWLTSPLFNQLSQQNPEMFVGLRILLVGGDALSPRHIQAVRKKCTSLNIVNGYGPTENTTFSTCFLINHDYEKNIPIGSPISNSTAYILDENCNIMPIGMPGELCVGGDGVARGYLNRPELTAEKFIQNPFDTTDKLYRTGDLAMWLEDGNIEFLGRIDQQVKIRGFRVELQEIENHLLKHNDIKDIVIVAKLDKNNNKYLCAYFVANRELSVPELREHISNSLPEYMVPSYFVQLQKLPITLNGKVDRKALPEPDREINIGVEYHPPRNEAEKKLTEIWQCVLGVLRVGIEDNFFELGGDSIRSIQVSAGIQKHGFTIGIQDLFKNPTIRELSNCLKSVTRTINQVPVQGEVSLTPIQKWFFEQNFKDKHHFNQAIMLFNKDGFDENIVRSVFYKIVEHHDALRMVYRDDNNKIIQINRGVNGELFNLVAFDLYAEDNYVSRIEEEANKLQSGMELANGPLVKLGLFKTVDGDYLLIAIHHLVVDGVSWRIIFEDFEQGYKQVVNKTAVKFQNKSDSFKYWSEKLQTFSNSRELLKQVEYWEKLENTKVEPLPKDNITIGNKMCDSTNVKLKLSTDETGKLLKQVNNAYNTGINDILLLALGLAVKEWTGDNNILINLEGHGREDIIHDIDITRTVGWFTSTYPVLLDMTKSEDLQYMIKTTKENLRRIPNNGFGYGVLKYLTLDENKKSLNFSLKPEICFNYLGQFDQDVNTEMFSMSDIPTGFMVSPNSERQYVFDINGMVSVGELKFTFNYNKEQFKEETVMKFVESFRNNLLKIIDHCVSKDGTELTPADLCDEELSIEELEEISNMISSI